jgi:hypothetical protein
LLIPKWFSGFGRLLCRTKESGPRFYFKNIQGRVQSALWIGSYLKGKNYYLGDNEAGAAHIVDETYLPAF